LKFKLKITDNDNPEMVRARMASDFFSRYDPLDIDALLDK
jgi:hypothetical protein